MHGVHPLPHTAQRDAELQDSPHLPVGWSLHFVCPQALSMPRAVLKPEVTWLLSCSWWEDAAAP